MNSIQLFYKLLFVYSEFDGNYEKACKEIQEELKKLKKEKDFKYLLILQTAILDQRANEKEDYLTVWERLNKHFMESCSKVKNNLAVKNIIGTEYYYYCGLASINT